MILDFFEKAFVLNLPSRKSRLERILQRLDTLNIPVEVVEGIITKDENGFSSTGHHGCAMSHLKIWEKIKESNIKNALIFEDDAMFRDDTSDILKEAVKELPIDWDMFYLGLFMLEPLRRKISPHIRPFVMGVHFHAYAVNSKVLPIIIEQAKKLLRQDGKKMPIDVIIATAPLVKKYHADPLLSVQEPSSSDTGGNILRLNEYFQRFSRYEFVENCKELKKWYESGTIMYT